MAAVPKKQAVVIAKKKSTAAADKLIGQLTATPHAAPKHSSEQSS